MGKCNVCLCNLKDNMYYIMRYRYDIKYFLKTYGEMTGRDIFSQLSLLHAIVNMFTIL